MRRYRGTFGWLTRLATNMRSMAIPSFAAWGALSANRAVRAARATSFRRAVAASAASFAASSAAAAGTDEDDRRAVGRWHMLKVGKES